LKKNNKSNRKKKTIDATNSITPEIGYAYRNKLTPRTSNQKLYIDNVHRNTITFCQGLAGSGKTHIAVGVALEYLLENKVKKIIITRPVLEAGERIGYLPGTAEEKLHPYLLPIVDEILHFIPMAQYASLKLNNKIEVVPLGLMRGRNFHDSFVIADECQNASYDQLKMLLTRVGQRSKMVLTGDVKQSDLSKHLQGGFNDLMSVLNDIDGVSLIRLESSDIVRNPIIVSILDKLETYENEERK